jgi:CheY-like chemotaxis protein
MALRVLLADESLNIKKNLQIALQDYGVEIKTVLSGDEVASAAKGFKPDIVFLDVLLAKINGYDACAQFKNHPDFRHIPVVLLWSSFMDIDETKFRQSKADGRLEKPFDKQSLRKLVQHFVPKTKSQGLSEFLTLPELRQESDADDAVFNKTLTHFTPKGGALGDLKMDDEPDDFHQGPSPFQSTIPEISPLTTQSDEVEEWVPRSIHATPTQEESYEVEIARVELPADTPPVTSPELDTLPVMGRPRRTPSAPPKYAGPPPQIQLDQKQLDELIRSELRPIVEKAIAKALPEIAERVIREELERLMRDTENEI